MGSYRKLRQTTSDNWFAATIKLRLSPGRLPFLWLILGLTALALLILLPRFYVLAIIVAVVGWAFVIVTFGSLATGNLDWIVLGWVTFFPLGYYFLSIPTTQPIFTLDRAVIALFVLGGMSIRRSRTFPLLNDVKAAGRWWLGFLIVGLLSIWDLSYRDMIGPVHILVEDFLMPVLLGWFVMSHFDVRKNLAWLHACSCIMSTYIASIGLAELATGRNLLEVTGSAESVPVNDIKVMRVDGPFGSATSYGLIGIIGFILILYLRRYLPKRLPFWQATLHRVGVVAALGVGLMPMHRGLIVALLAICIVDYFSTIHLVSRRSSQVFWLFLLGGIGTAKILAPALYADRVANADNIYSRLAQHKQTLQVIADHPLIGVGITRFYEAVYMKSRYFTTFQGFDSMNFAHSTIMSIAAETGIIGLMCYLVSQFCFAKAIWKTREFNPLGWQAFLYVFMIYTIFGLDITSGYLSDVNLWYMLTLAVITQLQVCSVAEVLQLRSVPNA